MKKLFLAFAFGAFAIMPGAAQNARTGPAPAGLSETVQLAQAPRYQRRWERRRYERPYRCRWVTERRVRPNGRVVIRRIQRCW